MAATKIGHAHFGGNLRTQNGRTVAGSKTGVGAGKTFRQQRRFEMIVRMENAQLPHAFIASSLCISKNRLTYIMKSPEYLNTRIAITHGIILDHESKLALIKEQRRDFMMQLLPPAWQAIANTLQRPATTIAEHKLQISVAQDILDREGTFAKISRTEIKPVDNFDYDSADKVSASTLSAIKGIFAPPADKVTAALTANQQFSRSNTISHVDQQEALKQLEALEPASDSVN